MSPKIIENFYGFNNYYLVLELEDYFNFITTLPLKEYFNNCNQILLLTEGEISYWVNNCKYKSSEKTLITFSRNQLQKLSKSDLVEGHIILFSDELLKETDFELFKSLNSSFYDFVITPCCNNLDSNRHAELLHKFKFFKNDIYQINNHVKMDITKNLIMRILDIIEQLKVINNININHRDKLLFKEFSLLLTKNLNQSRSVKYYANLLCISSKKLNVITKTYRGKTAKEFIEERIVFDSKKLLLDTHNTVKQISYSMGFTEPTNFNKFFKKYTDTTPLKFRELQNKGTF